VELPAIHNTARSRSYYSVRKRAIHLDFRENKQTKLFHLPTSSMQVDRVKSCSSKTGEPFTTSSPELSQKVFIDLKFKERWENTLLKNYLPLNLKKTTVLSDEVESQVSTSLVSGTKSQVSLTRSKTLADSYIPEVKLETKGQHAHKPEDPHSPEKLASVSYSDTKLSSKMESKSMSRWTKLSEEEILSRSTTDSKQGSRKDYLTVPIPKSKVEAIESWVERRSLTGTLTPSSFESKYTSRSSELSDRVIFEKECTRKQKIKEIETYAKWLAQGYVKPMSTFRRAENKTHSGRIAKHFMDENVEQWSKRVTEPLSVKKPRNQAYDGIAELGIFSINNDEEPQASGDMNAPFRFKVEREAREQHRFGRLECSANV